ncbi:MAG: ADP-ribosylglycohydrolase family protein [Porticoccaceae bacterium]
MNKLPSLERKLIKAELKQRAEEGCDTTEITERITVALQGKDNNDDIYQLYEDLIALPIEKTFPYVEPSDLKSIQAQRPSGVRDLKIDWNSERIYDQIYGAWLGRAAGCVLGKPVEGWPKERIDKYLKDHNIDILDNYLPFDEKVLPGVHKVSTRGNINFMPRDDDMDYVIIGLLALEKRGIKTSARTIANTWVDRLPFNVVYTAEECAYRNFVNSIWPPLSGTHRNPFREWIGAQIRADVFGYVTPGLPEIGAKLAFNDASISHDKNGIYGEMFVAAMLSAAFKLESVKEIINAGLAEIPENCRLAEAVKDTMHWCETLPTWELVWEKINESVGHYHGVHTINNAALVVMGLYFGEDNFEKGIVCTVRGGWDTDCTGATVGSILGLRLGAKNLPSKWISPLNDRLKSVVRDENDNKISELAKRTLSVAKTILEEKDHKAAGLKEQNTASVNASFGTWELEAGWGHMILSFEKGEIDFINDGYDAYPIVSSSYNNPELKFSFGIDKGGWDFEIDFEGTIDGDQLEGIFHMMDTPVKGHKISK